MTVDRPTKTLIRYGCTDKGATETSRRVLTLEELSAIDAALRQVDLAPGPPTLLSDGPAWMLSLKSGEQCKAFVDVTSVPILTLFPLVDEPCPASTTSSGYVTSTLPVATALGVSR